MSSINSGVNSDASPNNNPFLNTNANEAVEGALAEEGAITSKMMHNFAEAEQQQFVNSKEKQLEIDKKQVEELLTDTALSNQSKSSALSVNQIKSPSLKEQATDPFGVEPFAKDTIAPYKPPPRI